MLLVDVHCHLTDKRLNAKEVVDRAKKAGIKVIVTNGTNYEDNLNVLELSKKFDIVKPALGLYPLDAVGLSVENGELIRGSVDVEKVLKQIELSKPIAIGEVGVDFKWTRDYDNEQIEVFQKIIKLAEKMNKPLIVHSRNAEKECTDLLENTKTKVVMHCFGGNKKLVKRCIDNKFYFSIPPIINKSTHFHMVAELCPLSKLLTETDSPWLSPFPDKLNEPAFVLESLKEISNIKKITIEECSNQIFKNFNDLF